MSCIDSSEGFVLNESSISQSISRYLAKGVVVAFQKIDECRGELFAEETALIRSAVAKRKREFTAGRLCARAALKELGITQSPIMIGTMREPIWPLEVAGSITHDGDYCVVSVGYKKDIPLIGIDLAVAEPLGPELIKYICTEEEVTHIDSMGKSSFDIDPYKVVFSLKESIYKCLFPSVQEYIDFKDVSVLIDPTTRTSRIRLLNERLFSEFSPVLNSKFLNLGNNYLFTAVWKRPFP